MTEQIRMGGHVSNNDVYEPETFKLIRNAHVEVAPVYGKGHTKPYARITVNGGEIVHDFSQTSRVSRHLDVMDAQALSERLSGGDFFVVDDKLIDFRDGQYNGFTHSDDAIGHFMDTLGVSARPVRSRLLRNSQSVRDESQLRLARKWDTAHVEVPGYAGGADFNTVLSYEWSPFEKHINSTLEIVRLICTNGMVGISPLLNAKIPLQNRWEEHLDIAAKQIQNKINGIINSRIDMMVDSPASVGDCLLLEQHAFDRLHSANQSLEDRDRLMALMNAVSPKVNLDHVYRPSVFEERTVADQLPSHLSMYDVFNVATEMRSHTGSSANSSANALDRLANALLIDREPNVFGAKQTLVGLQERDQAFENARTAFFGVSH